MSRRSLRSFVILVAIGIMLTFVSWGIAQSVGSDHGGGPTLECSDCHGDHPTQSGIPQAVDMSCFDCHAVI
ncbi:hypothetical protein ACFLSW_01675 [Candidatus Bipolaricaulota bacterium]